MLAVTWRWDYFGRSYEGRYRQEVRMKPEDELRKFGVNDQLLEWLRRLAAAAPTAERFADLAMVGPCPACGSDATSDCDESPGIDDMTVGICTSCAHLWCLECGSSLSFSNPTCSGWKNDPTHGAGP